MPKYIIRLQDQQASPDEVAAEKKKIESHGGKIVETYTLIKGFVVEFPEGSVSALESDPKLGVELDSEVHTQ